MARILDEAAVRVGAETRDSERDAGRAGERFGRRFAQGADRQVGRSRLTERLAAQVEAASARILRARESEAGAAARVRVAEQRLLEIRESGHAKASQILAAEDRLNQARRTAARRVEDVTRATRDLERAEQRLKDSHDQLLELDPIGQDFERRLRATITQIAGRVNAGIRLTPRGERFRQDVARQLLEVQRSLRAEIPADPVLAADFRRSLTRQVDDVSRRVRARIAVGVDVDRNMITRSLSGLIGLLGRFGSRMQSVASSAVSPLTSALGLFNVSLVQVIATALGISAIAPPLAAGLAVIGGAATAAFGAISAGVVGLPVVLTSLLAPIAAITLGMDGIKRAAEPLKDEVKALKDVVSIAFENGMRPVFEKLQALFPTLNVGLAEVARGVTRVAMDFTQILTTPAGIEKVRIALAGVSDTIDRARPGLRALFQALLDVAGTRELYDILGDTLGGVADRFAGMVQRVRASGDLTGALEQLRAVLFSVSDLLFSLAEGAIKFFRSAGPGLASFFDSLTGTLSRIDWAGLGAAFGDVMDRIGRAIANISPETWERFGGAIKNLVDRFLEWMESGVMENTINSLSILINILGFLSDVLLVVQKATGGLIGFLGSLASGAGSLAGTIGGAFSGIGGAVADGLGGLPAVVDEKLTEVGESVDRNLGEGGFTEKVRGAFAVIGETITSGMGSAAETVSAGLSDWGERVDEFFSNLPDRIGYWIGFIGTTMTIRSGEAVNGALEWFGKLPERAEVFAADMVLRLQTFFTALPGQLMTWSTMAITAVAGVFRELPDKVGEHAAKMVLRLQTFFTELPGKLADWAGKAVTAVVDVFRELPGKVAAWARKTIDDVIKFFRELPGKLLQAGRDAIQGFINGLKEKAASVVSTIKDIVTGARRGAEDALAQQSPSRVFRDIGRNTIQGYIIGLRERLAPLLATIRAMFTQASEAAAGLRLEPAVDVVLGSVSEQVWDRLLAMGYRGDPTDRREALVDVPLSALRAAQGTSGTGPVLSQADLQALAAAVAQALAGVQLEFVGPSVAQIVRDDDRLLARR